MDSNMSKLELATLLKTSILEPMDAVAVAKLISEAPFVSVPGVANFRDIGDLPITKHLSSTGDQNAGKDLEVRTGRLFRSGQFNDITSEGRKNLRSLNIGAIFDLRTLAEVRKYGGVTEDNQDTSAGFVKFTEEGIDVHHIPMLDLKQITPEEHMAMVLLYCSGEDGFLKGYEEMLGIGGNSFSKIMKYILEQIKVGDQGRACAWNCHIGKDRTGLFSALLLELLGVPDEAISEDYALTRVGLEAIRPEILIQWKELITKYPQGAVSLASSNASLMMRVLALIRNKYGGAKGYFINESGLTEEELDSIRAGLIVVSKKKDLE